MEITNHMHGEGLKLKILFVSGWPLLGCICSSGWFNFILHRQDFQSYRKNYSFNFELSLGHWKLHDVPLLDSNRFYSLASLHYFYNRGNNRWNMAASY